MRRALVTGASGFLGRYIARDLAARGIPLVLISRSTPPPDLLQAGAIWRQVDLERPLPPDLLEGVDTVFHAAAKAGIWGPRSSYFAANHAPTLRLLDAARQAGVARFIYTSSPSVAYSSAVTGADESLPMPRSYLAHYPASKAAAEAAVLAANDPSFATTALRPHLIYGPEDTNLLPRLAERARSGRLRRVGDGSAMVDVTFVENAARAHVMAALALGAEPRGACAGRAYFIGDAEPVRLWSWVDSLLRSSALPPLPARGIPLPVARALGLACETLWTLTRRSDEPPMTRFLALQLGSSHYFNHAAAARDFGWTPHVDAPTALARTATWLREQAAP